MIFFPLNRVSHDQAQSNQLMPKKSQWDSLTDLFDPLLTDRKNAVGNHVMQSNLASITEAREN